MTITALDKAIRDKFEGCVLNFLLEYEPDIFPPTPWVLSLWIWDVVEGGSSGKNKEYTEKYESLDGSNTIRDAIKKFCKMNEIEIEA